MVVLRWILIFSSYLVFNPISWSQIAAYEWAQSKSGSVAAELTVLDVDQEQNVVIASSFNGHVTTYLDFNQTIPSVGMAGFVMSKVDSLGNEVWIRQLSEYTIPTDIQIGSDTSIYLALSWSSSPPDSLDIDPGPGVTMVYATESGSRDNFIVKFSSDGEYVWHYQFPRVSLLFGMELGPNNELYVAGLFSDTLDLDQGPGITNVFNPGTSDNAAFMCKYSNSGSLLWTNYFEFDDTSLVRLSEIAISGNQVVFGGNFRGTVDFCTSAIGDVLTSDLTGLYNRDLYLLSLDTSGTFNWVKHFTGPGNFAGNAINAISFTPNDDIIIYGAMSGTLDLDPDSGVHLVQAASNNKKNFILKLDNSGSFQWVRADHFSELLNPQIFQNMFIDDQGNIFYCHYQQYGFIDMDITWSQDIELFNWNDFFIAKLNPCGNYVGAIHIENTSSGTNANTLNNLVMDDHNNLYALGTIEDPVDFDPSVGSAFLSPVYQSTFLARYKCDNSFINTTVASEVTCDSLIWLDGQTYTSSTSGPVQILSSVEGCDSLVTLDLTVHNSHNVTDSVFACNSFTWIDGNTYTNSNNTANVLLSTSHGCDSLVTLNLTIDTLVASIVLSDSLQLQAIPTGTNYQWLNCDNNYTPITGEIDQTYQVLQNGQYAVQITNNTCVDTSDCLAINTVQLIENSFAGLKLYPNPTNELVYLQFDELIDFLMIEVFDLQGKRTDLLLEENTSLVELKLKGEAGMYFIHVTKARDKKAVFRVIKGD